MTVDAAEVLDAAADVLEMNDWGRRAFWYLDPNTGVRHYCALGAIVEANSGDVEDAVGAKSALAWYLFREFGAMNIPQWNDFKAKDKFEVIDAMRNTAKELRNGIGPELSG